MDPALLREREAFKKTFSQTTASVGAAKSSAESNGLGSPSAKKKSYGPSKKDQGNLSIRFPLA